MMLLLAMQGFCSFISLFLFTIKYYETASDIDCLLRKSSLRKNRLGKKRLKVTAGILLVFSLDCYIPLNISMYLTENNFVNDWQDLLAVILAVASMCFLLLMSIILAMACYKLVKLV